MRVYLHDVGLFAACLSLLFLALYVRVSRVSLVCALKHVNSPICVIPCFASFMLALWHLMWAFLLLFASLHPCLHVHACVFMCLFVSSSIVHTRFFTRNFAWWHMCRLYQIQTQNCPLRTPFLFVCSITCLFTLLYTSFPLLSCLICFLSAFFVSFLSLLLVCWLCVFFVCCMYTLGV